MPSQDRNRKLTSRIKIAFAFGSLEESMLGAAGVATMLFYNQILGVSASLCGLAFLIASIVDAVTDPLVGAFTDNWHSRWGRRHPFMVMSAVPLAVCYYFLYQPPTSLAETGLFVWLTGTTVLLRLFKTFFVVPHNALGAELTDDYHERTSIFGYNLVAGMGGGLVLGVFVLMVIFPSTPEYQNGLLNPDGYRFLAIFGAIVIAAVILICCWGTRSQIPHLHLISEGKEPMSLTGYFSELWSLLHNRSFLAVSVCWFILATTGGILGMVFTYIFVYAFEFSTDLATCYTSAFLVGLPLVLRLLGLFPENGSSWLVPCFFVIWGANVFSPVTGIVVDSMMGDVADEHELKTGSRSEGMIFAIKAFGMKLTAGLGGMFGGFGLDIIGFPKNAVVGQIAPEVIDRMLFSCGPLFWIIVGLGNLFMLRYAISQKRHGQIIEELKKKRGVAESSSERAL